MAPEEIKDLNVLVDNKPFFDQPMKKQRYDNLFKYQETITIQRKSY